LAPPTLLAGLIPALITVGLGIYFMHLPHVLYGVHEYDDGVYLGAALRLVHGVLPYRDFVIVHPPGVVVLMAPFAALAARLGGTDVAMALGRDLTIFVAAVNTVLAGRLVRHRGPWAMLIAGLALACFPMAPAADSTLLLEPYLVCFALIGLILMFRVGRLAGPGRVLVGGLFLGASAAMKIWGFLVLGAVLVVCLRRLRQAFLPVLVGGLAGFLAFCLPFIVAAPGAFFHDVFVDQFRRVEVGSAGLSQGQPAFGFGERLKWLTGSGGLTLLRAGTVATIAVGALAVCAAGLVTYRFRRRICPAEWALLLCATVATAAMLAPAYLFAHYVYFPAAFIAPLIGGATPALVRRLRLPRRLGTKLPALAVVIAGVAFFVPQQAGFARSHLTTAIQPTILNLVIPARACVVSDDSSVAIAADLYVPSRPGCPAMVDSFGTWLADGPTHEPPYAGPFTAGFVDEWADWLNQSDYVIQTGPFGSFLPWTPALRSWFTADFKLAWSGQKLFVYEHVHHAPPPLAQ
jgi:hypothetical protein